MSDRFLAEHILTDLYTYCSDGLGFTLHEEPHRKMAAFFEAALPPHPRDMATAEQKYVAYAAPRETLKTSIGVQGLAEYFALKWKIEYGYDARILIVRAAKDAAEGVLLAVREDLTGASPTLTRAFGDLSKDSPLWTSESITFAGRRTSYREPTIDTASPGQSKTGAHIDLIILDDLCNEKNFESDVEMAKARRYIQACIPILNSWGTMLHIGTRWGNQDTTGWILGRNEDAEARGEEPPWTVEIHGAYNDDGSLFYPGYLTEKRLGQKRANLDDRLFSSQYLNKVVAEGSQVFQAAWLSFFDADADYEPDGDDIATLTTVSRGTFAVSAAILIDPAATATNSSNSTAMALVLTDGSEKPEHFVYDFWKGRELPSMILDRLVTWCVRYRPARVSIDTLGQQVLWIDLIAPRLREAGVQTHLMLHKGKAISVGGEDVRSSRGVLSKAARIENMQPYFRQRRIHFRTGVCRALVGEYNTYTGPTTKEHYDGLDSLSQFTTVSVQPRIEYYRDLVEQREWDEDYGDEPSRPSGRKVPATMTGRVR